MTREQEVTSSSSDEDEQSASDESYRYGRSDKTGFRCDQCEKTFPTRTRLRLHRETHLARDERTKFECHLCDKSYFKTSHLDLHIDSFHRKLKPYTCKQCGSSFCTEQERDLHIQTRRSPDTRAKFACDQCDKTYFQRGHLQLWQTKICSTTTCRCTLSAGAWGRHSPLDGVLTRQKLISCESNFTSTLCTSVHKIRFNTHAVQCDKSFLHKISLKMHTLREHNLTWPVWRHLWVDYYYQELNIFWIFIDFKIFWRLL